MLFHLAAVVLILQAVAIPAAELTRALAIRAIPGLTLETRAILPIPPTLVLIPLTLAIRLIPQTPIPSR